MFLGALEWARVSGMVRRAFYSGVRVYSHHELKWQIVNRNPQIDSSPMVKQKVVRGTLLVFNTPPLVPALFPIPSLALSALLFGDHPLIPSKAF